MKKLFIAALMMATATSAMAQDIKTVLKAKDYAEAQSSLNACLSSLNSEDKAKAYQKLVELSMKAYDKENAAIIENQTLEQMGQKGDKPVDKPTLYSSLYQALKDANECDKYDKQPNAKGKVAPKYSKKFAESLWGQRFQLVNGGQDALQAEDNTSALKYFGEYVDSEFYPLFSTLDKSKYQAPVQLGEVARVAAQLAYQQKDMTAANRYIDVAIDDTATYKDAISIKMYFMQQSLNTREDSLKCLNEFEKLYAKNSNDENVFANLASFYGALGMDDKRNAVVESRLSTNPNDFMALAIKGQSELSDNNLDAAIADLTKAAAQKDDALILYLLGVCYNNKAAAEPNAAKQKELLEQTKDYLEKARQIDPNQQRANWKYMLYNTYYNLYGENDARTKELAQ